MIRRLLLVAVLLAGCAAPAAVPWQSDLPAGARVIYTVDHGLGICDGLQGCPTRIFQTGDLCITETYRAGSGWEFRDSKACAAPRPAETVIPTSSPPSSGLSRNPSLPTGAPIGPPPSGSHLPTVAAVGEPAQRTAIPSAAHPASVTARLTGTLAHMGNSPVGPRYAAIPWGPGIRVRICAARCVTVVSADTGPSLAMQRRGRVADVSVELFVAICGKPASAGLCQGTVSR